jgi:hypothetical protein
MVASLTLPGPLGTKIEMLLHLRRVNGILPQGLETPLPFIALRKAIATGQIMAFAIHITRPMIAT